MMIGHSFLPFSILRIEKEESKIVEATRDVLTRGTYMGEEGVGYSWGITGEMGDYSHATRGRLQGYREPCKIEILVEGAVLEESQGGDILLYLPNDQFNGMFASEAIERGFAKVVKDA